MFNLAVCYDDGYGVSQDNKKSFELYQRAADMGNTYAVTQLKNKRREKDFVT